MYSRETQAWLKKCNNPGICSAIAGTWGADSRYIAANPPPAVRAELNSFYAMERQREEEQQRMTARTREANDAMQREREEVEQRMFARMQEATRRSCASMNQPIYTPPSFGSSGLSSLTSLGSSSLFSLSSSSLTGSSTSSSLNLFNPSLNSAGFGNSRW